MKKSFKSPQTQSIRTVSRRPKITRPLRQKLPAAPIQNDEDRFIANRSSIDFDWARHLVNKSNVSGNTSSTEEYNMTEQVPDSSVLVDNNKMSRILSFSKKASAQGLQSIYSEALSVENEARSSRSHTRYIPQHADRTLDAPYLVDDNHLNLLDWSIESNIVSIALGNAVYLWDASRGITSELLTVDSDVGPVGSVNWSPDGKNIAIGLTSSHGAVQIWDTTSNRQVRSLKGHRGRVGSFSWNGSSTVASGGEDGRIIVHDVRVGESCVKTYRGHKEEVCGLKWSSSGDQLASGGSDSLVHIWDRGMSSSSSSRYLHRMEEHCDAVTALAWCPFQHNLLASGAALADQSIKLWNSLSGACLKSVDTNSSVNALLWNRHERELLSAHGYSDNQLTLWKYPSMTKIADLTGHTSRVLHLAQSPDGYTVASAGADETLRFWKVFGTPDTSKNTKTKEPESILSTFYMHIR